jgi:hypothetical protein
MGRSVEMMSVLPPLAPLLLLPPDLLAQAPASNTTAAMTATSLIGFAIVSLS